jgi:single-strand DNA-binding protein
MANINRVVLVGNLTKDPELRHTPSGTAVCKLRIAVNTRQKDQATGEWGDKPNYFDVTVWGNQGESCAQFLSKGRPVGVDGRLDWREWEAQDGTKRQAVEIIADSVQFLGSRDGGGVGEPQFVPAAATAATDTAGPAEELLLLQGEGRGGRLQELQPAPALHLGEGQDPLAPHHGRVPPPPAAGRGRREARARDGAPPVRRRLEVRRAWR